MINEKKKAYQHGALSFSHFLSCISIYDCDFLCRFVHETNEVISDMENLGNSNGQLQIELKEDVAQGIYANLAIISHSTSEFIVDFIRVMPGMPKAGVQSRIILAPEHAKRLMNALRENIDKYERVYGTIHFPSEEQMLPLAGIQGEA